jgi:hypothetical protein
MSAIDWNAMVSSLQAIRDRTCDGSLVELLSRSIRLAKLWQIIKPDNPPNEIKLTEDKKAIQFIWFNTGFNRIYEIKDKEIINRIEVL